MSLIETPLESVAAFFRGVLDVQRTRTGVVALRLPRWAWRQVPDARTREVFRMAAGVRLLLATQATTLEMDVAASHIAVDELDLPRRRVAIDLFVNGADTAEHQIECVSEWRFNIEGELLAAEEPKPVTVRFDGLSDTDKVVEVWLPANASVEVRGLRADAALRPVKETRPRWIHYGSSISHCAEALRPSQAWPAVTARLAGADLLNLGVGGSCHLDPFVARAIRDAPGAFISLKVGINIAGGDTLKYRTFVPAIHGFLDTVRDGHADTPILIISPIICPMLEDSPGPVVPDGSGGMAAKPENEKTGRNALSLRTMRHILHEIVDDRANEDEQLHYLDGERLFGESDLPELPDGVHPSPAGYIRIGERFAEIAFGRDGCFAEDTKLTHTASNRFGSNDAKEPPRPQSRGGARREP